MCVIFGANFQNFELKMHVAVVQWLKGDTQGPQEGPKCSSMAPKIIEVNKVYTLICFTD